MNKFRTRFLELQRLVGAGAVTDKLVYSPARLARGPLDLLLFCRLCTEAGVNIHFVEGPSGNDEYPDLVRFVTGFAGSLEGKMIAERTIRGKQHIAKTANRLPNGYGRGIYGYDYDKDAVS